MTQRTQTTHSAKPTEIERKWHIIDVADLVLGRAASEAASLLRGKHKPIFSPNIDCGDHVVIINAEKVHMTGNKCENEKYYHHTGHPGGIKVNNFDGLMAKDPREVLMRAVKGMLPRGPLGRKMLTKLKVYSGAEHPHQAQQPQEWIVD